MPYSSEYARRSLACLVLLLPCSAAVSAVLPDSIEVSLDARPSLFYYLECAAESLSCSKDEVGALLTGILGRDEATRLAEDWAKTLTAYAVHVKLRKPPAPEWPDIGPDSSASLDVRARIQDVLFSGGTPDRVREKLAVVMSPADVRALEGVVESAWPAYSRWWAKHESGWRGYAAQLATILQSDAATTVRSAERMFGHVADERLAVHLIPLPVAGPVNRAFQKGRRSFVEFRPDDDPATRVAVIVHEYCHYLFRAAPQELHQARMDAFAAAPEPSAASAFAVLNEALATAIGNGLFMKAYLGAERFDAYSSRPESFYANPAIDRAAKAALPFIEQYARTGRAIDREFFADYFRRASAVFADEPADPRIVLGVSQAYYTSDPLERVAIDTGMRYGFNSVYYDEWKPGTLAGTMGMQFRSIPVAVFAGPDDYEKALEALVPGAALPTVGGEPAASCKVRRASGGWVYLFIVTPGTTSVELSGQVPDCDQLSAP